MCGHRLERRVALHALLRPGAGCALDVVVLLLSDGFRFSSRSVLLCRCSCALCPVQTASYQKAILALDDTCTMIYVAEMALLLFGKTVCVLYSIAFVLLMRLFLSFVCWLTHFLCLAVGFKQFFQSGFNILGRVICLACAIGFSWVLVVFCVACIAENKTHAHTHTHLNTQIWW